MESGTAASLAGDSRAFTLFETLLAAAILSLVTVGVLSAVNGAFLADRTAANTTSSQTIAKRVMEESLGTAYDDLLNLHGNTAVVDGFTVQVAVVQQGIDVRLIEVTVTKRGAPGGRTRLVMLRAAR
jgi:type II secretory pathway component PulJ